MNHTKEQRRYRRVMCSSPIKVSILDAAGLVVQQAIGVLEDVSRGGTAISIDVQIEPGSTVILGRGDPGSQGIVRYCIRREDGYCVGLEFASAGD